MGRVSTRFRRPVTVSNRFSGYPTGSANPVSRARKRPWPGSFPRGRPPDSSGRDRISISVVRFRFRTARIVPPQRMRRSRKRLGACCTCETKTGFSGALPIAWGTHKEAQPAGSRSMRQKSVPANPHLSPEIAVPVEFLGVVDIYPGDIFFYPQIALIFTDYFCFIICENPRFKTRPRLLPQNPSPREDACATASFIIHPCSPRLFLQDTLLSLQLADDDRPGGIAPDIGGRAHHIQDAVHG